MPGRLTSFYKNRSALLLPLDPTFLMCSEFLPEPCPCAGAEQRGRNIYKLGCKCGWRQETLFPFLFPSWQELSNGKREGNRSILPCGGNRWSSFIRLIPAFGQFSMKK